MFDLVLSFIVYLFINEVGIVLVRCFSEEGDK